MQCTIKGYLLIICLTAVPLWTLQVQIILFYSHPSHILEWYIILWHVLASCICDSTISHTWEYGWGGRGFERSDPCKMLAILTDTVLGLTTELRMSSSSASSGFFELKKTKQISRNCHLKLSCHVLKSCHSSTMLRITEITSLYTTEYSIMRIMNPTK